MDVSTSLHQDVNTSWCGGANVPSASHNGELVNKKIAKVIEKNRQAAEEE
jgi:hypothetical protein